ncbi:alpha/beta fold hydrolase [Dyella sp. BiH032]|uniref:esterase/lipase family protein n=1 Tax=Dyella sp. BiH032 TaxID=3075430 RepID=UPI0028931E64|nr:alpha/beta fold hydrolase [Dyella sp. BiH032]WNL44314.1 alpha/beta fold hydrolase [Dyella sp. BiH032]
MRFALLAILLCLNGCAMVGVSRINAHDSFSEQRGDVISAGRLGDQSVQSLNVVALTARDCERAFPACVDTVLHSPGLNEEQRLSALAELWLERAIRADGKTGDGRMSDEALDAYMQAGRYAYAYLFYTKRQPSERSFELRQVQVIGFYNFAVQRAMARFFAEIPRLDPQWTHIDLAGWSVARAGTDTRWDPDAPEPSELIPASVLRFNGLRNVYRRDGFGSEFVAVAPPDAPGQDGASAGMTGRDVPWRDPDYMSMTGAILFDGTSLEDVLATRQAKVLVEDPYRVDSVKVAGRTVPLAGNFTAAYGVWLARSGFASQSIRSLLGREGGIKTPRVLLMQPYDPDRMTVIMLHGLASSPEAWINVSNEVMGDEDLRRHYQVWEIYYPTNAPIAVNLANIRKALDATFKHFDPGGEARASKNVVLIGHSMGGVIARLLVSSSGDRLWSLMPPRANLSAAKQARLRERLAPYLQFTPMPQVTRAVFLASPQRGTPYAQNTLARWIGNLIRLPANVLKEVASVADLLKEDGDGGKPVRIPNSIDNLSDADPFVVAAADLPVSPQVRYHTIVGVYTPPGPLADSSDGVVPYKSAHLDGAESELAVPSWHSVQETPAAILELRRILRLHVASVDAAP